MVKLTVRSQPEELALWKDAAHVRRLSLSEWVRRVLIAAAEDAVLGADRTVVPGGLAAGDSAGRDASPRRERPEAVTPGTPLTPAASPSVTTDFKKGK